MPFWDSSNNIISSAIMEQVVHVEDPYLLNSLPLSPNVFLPKKKRNSSTKSGNEKKYNIFNYTFLSSSFSSINLPHPKESTEESEQNDDYVVSTVQGEGIFIYKVMFIFKIKYLNSLELYLYMHDIKKNYAYFIL